MTARLRFSTLALFIGLLAPRSFSATPTLLRVLQFNVWQEGTSVENGLEKIRDVIVATKADLVCFSEVRNYKKEDWTAKVIAALGAKGHVFHGRRTEKCVKNLTLHKGQI